MAVFLVRHAAAGDRSKWDGPDERRPLSEKGHRQAERVADLLASNGIRRTLSSPYRRCVQTVRPLAARLGLEVETDDALAEDAFEDDVVGLVRKLAAENPVLCTHGDVIATLLDALARQDGLRLPDDCPCAKGSMWVLEGDADSSFTSAIYLPAP